MTPRSSAPVAPGPDAGVRSAIPQPRQFPNTRWTLVVAAGGPTSPQSRAALEELCRLYWYPVYGFMRRQGKSADDALDLTQGLFADILARKDFAVAHPERGKFRSWLLGCAKHYLARVHEHQTAQKRGGAQPTVPIDAKGAESRYLAEPTDGLTPETFFMRQWVWSALDGALRALRDETAEASLKRFEVLSPYLVDAGDQPYAEVARTLETTEGAVKKAISDLRDLFRGHLRARLADTVQGDTDLDAEIRELLDLLS